jgi:hypothetical protein
LSIHHHLPLFPGLSPSPFSGFGITRSIVSARVFDALLPYATHREPVANRFHPAVENTYVNAREALIAAFSCYKNETGTDLRVFLSHDRFFGFFLRLTANKQPSSRKNEE